MLNLGSKEEFKNITEYVLDLKHKLSLSHDIAAKCIDKSHDSNKNRFDRKVRSLILSPGDKCLIKNVGLQGKHKLEPLWSPVVYKVLRRIDDLHVYEVTPLHGSKGRPRVLHMDLLYPLDTDIHVHDCNKPETVKPTKVIKKHKTDDDYMCENSSDNESSLTESDLSSCLTENEVINGYGDVESEASDSVPAISVPVCDTDNVVSLNGSDVLVFEEESGIRPVNGTSEEMDPLDIAPENAFVLTPVDDNDVSVHNTANAIDATDGNLPLDSPSSNPQDISVDTCLEEDPPIRRSTRERRLPPYLRDFHLNRLKGYTLPKFIRYRNEVIHI
jgi:hypothetical protein